MIATSASTPHKPRSEGIAPFSCNCSQGLGTPGLGVACPYSRLSKTTLEQNGGGLGRQGVRCLISICLAASIFMHVNQARVCYCCTEYFCAIVRGAVRPCIEQLCTFSALARTNDMTLIFKAHILLMGFPSFGLDRHPSATHRPIDFLLHLAELGDWIDQHSSICRLTPSPPRRIYRPNNCLPWLHTAELSPSISNCGT